MEVLGQNKSGNTGLNSRPAENRSWRINPQSTYQIRNMEVETIMTQEDIEEERIMSTESGNECQPRL